MVRNIVWKLELSTHRNIIYLLLYVFGKTGEEIIVIIKNR